MFNQAIAHYLLASVTTDPEFCSWNALEAFYEIVFLDDAEKYLRVLLTDDGYFYQVFSTKTDDEPEAKPLESLKQLLILLNP